MPSNHILMIINQNSRSGNADLSAGIELFRERGFNLLEEFPDSPGDVLDLVRRHRASVDRIVIGGGDGTLNGAAEAILASGLPLGILPMGTANDLARTLNIPTELRDACAVIADGHTRIIDLGRVNEKYFFNVAHIGLGVRVTRQLSSVDKSYWGPLSYARSALKAIGDNRSFRAHINVNDRDLHVKSIEIAVGNGRYYGGGMSIAEDAEIDDNQLFLYSLKPLSFWKLMSLVPALRTGQHRGKEGVSFLNGQSITIRTKKPMTIYADGERVARTPATFGLLPNAIPVFVPPSNPGPMKGA